MTPPDLQQAGEFLKAIDPNASAWAFRTFDDVEVDGKGRKLPELTKVCQGTLESCAQELARLSGKGAGVFVTVNETDGKGRSKANIVRVRALFADFDKIDPTVPDRLRADSLPPSIIVESSTNKWHAYWLADGVELAEFTALQKQIIAEWGADAVVSDLPRVMRLPGFLHKKGAPQLVHLREVTGRRYGRELAERYKPAPAVRAERPERLMVAAYADPEPYATAALHDACTTVGDAVDGERNATLNREAFGIGQLVAGGAIPEALARDQLHEAAEFAGLGRSEALATIRSAFKAGAKEPRTVPTVDADQFLDDLADLNDEAGAPLPLLPDLAAPTPYPVDALPGVLRDACLAIAEHVMVPLAVAGQCVIGAATHLMQTRANTWNPSGDSVGVPCSLFTLTLAASGEGKSSARKLACRIIDESERSARQNTQMLESLEDAGAEPCERCSQYSDATFERIAGDFIRGNSAASWDTDEGGQMLGGASLKSETVRATLGGLTRAFDSGQFERARAKSNRDGSGRAYHRRLSVHLLAQPVAVAEALADPLLTGQGFLARFLFASPASLVGTRFITREHLDRRAHDDLRLRAYWDRCDEITQSPEHINLLTHEVTPPVFELDADARQCWMDFRNDIEIQSGPLGTFAGLRPFALRGAELALRLATVLAGFDKRDGVSGGSMRQACKLARYSLDEWLRYTDPAAIDPVLRQAAALMGWLRDPKHADVWAEFDKNRFSKSGPPALRTAKKRDPVLALLVKRRHLLICDGKTYRVNPLPQTSANLPHAESPVNAEFPQNPQNPQPPDASGDNWEDPLI
ncbi:MAG: DUF3987 domain-containing protein [Pseudomonas sp.]